MEINSSENIASANSATTSGICPVCHQPVFRQYYFCPNCGAKLKSAPLKTDGATQAMIYAFSVILPFIAFIFITRWQGVKYLKSPDKKAKQIGMIAWALLIISTIIVIWLAVVWTQNAIKASVNSINADMSF